MLCNITKFVEVIFKIWNRKYYDIQNFFLQFYLEPHWPIEL